MHRIFEQGAKFATLAEMMSETETEASYSEEELLALAEEGLDFDELACMDEEERREAIEDAGLDPDDCDFD